jgi:hypothetical protein
VKALAVCGHRFGSTVNEPWIAASSDSARRLLQGFESLCEVRVAASGAKRPFMAGRSSPADEFRAVSAPGVMRTARTTSREE